MSERAEVRRCRRCVLPLAPPDITLDGEGICNVCRAAPAVAPAGGLETDFVRRIARYRGRGRYDCLVMLSGGKDSTAALWYMVRRYRLRPLAFTFDHGFESEGALANVRRAVERLDVDFLYLRRTEMRELFRRVVESGSPAVLCHLCSIWYMQLTFDLAARFDIGLVIAGWTRGQATEPAPGAKGAGRADAPEYRAMAQATTDFLATLRKDPRWRRFPARMEDVVARARGRVVLSPHWFLEDGPDEYVPRIRADLGWEEPPRSYPADSTNCELNFLSSARSIAAFGYTHYHVEMSKLIRQGRMTREEALARLDMPLGDEVLDPILERLGCPRVPDGGREDGRAPATARTG